MRSIGHIARLQRILANDADFVTPLDMLAELREDNKQLTANMRETHDLCDEHRDVATASLLRTGSMRPSGGPGSCSKPPGEQSWSKKPMLRPSQLRTGSCGPITVIPDGEDLSWSC